MRKKPRVLQTTVQKTLLCWSSGKDSAWALHVLQRQSDIHIAGLVTTVNEVYERVAMHAVRTELLKRQAAAVGLPLWIANIPYPCSNSEYATAMRKIVKQSREQGVEYMAFGDIFLQDVREYREANLSDTGISPLFPLWGLPTDQLARDMISSGLRAYVTCIDPRHLSPNFVGQEYSSSFLDNLPANVDPCGERGEFHSFVFDGPMFSEPISVQVGEIVEREGFVFADLFDRQ
jgi:uncharacterized protein (TIGR00290 family)